MEYSEYIKVINNLPEKWYTDEELERFIQQAFLNEVKLIAKDFDVEVVDKEDIKKLYDLLAEDSGTSISEIEEDIAEAAHFMARLFLFDYKFPHVVSAFPANEIGQHVFPPVVLSKILKISSEEATEIASTYWGVPIEDGKLTIYEGIENQIE